MISTERVAVRLSPETLAVLEELVDKGEFQSVADAVGSAVQSLISSRFSPEEAEAIARSRSERESVDMGDLIRDGEPSLEGAVRSAVRDMVQSRLDREV